MSNDDIMGSSGATPASHSQQRPMTPQPSEQPRTPHPEDYCGRCGGRNPSWHAASPLWNAVMRSGDQEPFDGIICPNCFAAMAAEQGVTAHICLTTHDPTAPLTLTFGDGRVWDRNKCMWVDPVTVASPLDVERLALALDVLSEDGDEYALMAPEDREYRYEAAQRLAAAYAEGQPVAEEPA